MVRGTCLGVRVALMAAVAGTACSHPVTECVPATCAGLGLSCGDAPAGCGLPDLQCGACPCVPEMDAELCAASHSSCGPLSVTDSCGVARTAACGACVLPAACGGAGVLGQCGCAVSAADFCAAQGATCGSVTGVDSCGVSRTEACGTCSAPERCGGGGRLGRCGCSMSDSEFCAFKDVACGAVSGTDPCGVQHAVDCGACAGGAACGAQVPGECPVSLRCAGRRGAPAADAGVSTLPLIASLVPLCDGEVLVSDPLADRLAAIRVETGKIIGSFPLDGGPSALALDEDAGVAFVLIDSQGLARVDLQTGTVRQTVLPCGAKDLAVGTGGLLHVACMTVENFTAVNWLATVDGASLAQLGMSPVSVSAMVGFDRTRNVAIVGSAGGNQVWASYALDAGTTSFELRQYVDLNRFGGCGEIRVSSDGAHAVYVCTGFPYTQGGMALFDYSPADLSVPLGTWSTGANTELQARFSGDSRFLIAARYTADASGHAMVFSTSTHARLNEWSTPPPPTMPGDSTHASCALRAVDLSGNGLLAYFAEWCPRTTPESTRLSWWKTR